MCICDHILLILLRIKYVLNKSCRENQNTRFMFSNIFHKVVPLMR